MKPIYQTLNRRDYYFVTFLRDPVLRFLSEFKHVSRQGAPWRAATLKCRGRGPSTKELPPCHKAEHKGVDIDEFMGCRSNLAFNRGVPSTVTCQSPDPDKESASQNLESLRL